MSSQRAAKRAIKSTPKKQEQPCTHAGDERLRAIVGEKSGGETKRKKDGRQEESLAIENRETGRSAGQARQKEEQQDRGEDRQVGDELSNHIGRSRHRLRKQHFPLVPLGLRAARSGEQREKRDEIKSRLQDKDRDAVRIFAENNRGHSAEEREHGEDLEVAIDECVAKLARKIA